MKRKEKWPAWLWNDAGESRVFPGPDVPQGWMVLEDYLGRATAPDERDALRARLDALGVPYHHKAGVKRLAELLAEAEA